jgi:glycine/D-amino acid oxidase-like deaminating enzyme
VSEAKGNSMGPRVDSVPSDEALPNRVDVVIVGGGIIGTSTALFLARKGVSVALCEKGHIAHEQSSRNWGWCRKMARDPRELPLAIESLRIWEGMNEMVEAETGFRTSGIMYLAETRADLARFENWLDHARQYQLDSRSLAALKSRDACQASRRNMPVRSLRRPMARPSPKWRGRRSPGRRVVSERPSLPVARCAASRLRQAAW